MNTVFNYKNINFNTWKYFIMDLSSNILDYDKIDIIIHPLYELKQHNILDSQVNFKGKKKNLQYIEKLKQKSQAWRSTC